MRITEEEIEAKAHYRALDIQQARQEARLFMHWADPDRDEDDIEDFECDVCGAHVCCDDCEIEEEV